MTRSRIPANPLPSWGRASRGRVHLASALGLIAGLLTTVETTPAGSLTISAGKDAAAALSACSLPQGGSWQCELGDMCTTTCPQTSAQADGSAWLAGWVTALVPELWAQYDDDPVDHENWDEVFDQAWEKTKTLYPASWAPMYGSLEEGWLVDTMKASLGYRSNMSSIVNVKNAKVTLTALASTLDSQYCEACGDTSPAYFDYSSSPLPGYYLVPPALAQKPEPGQQLATPAYEVTNYWEDLTSHFEQYDVDDLYNGAHMGRLAPEFRVAARVASAVTDLLSAAREFRNGTGVNCEATARGNAYADLAVTGRRSFASFSALVAIPGFADGLVASLNGIPIDPAQVCDAPVSAGFAVQLAVDRAFHVANVLRVGSRVGTTAGFYRDSLGYIAVSGEDDSPYRPVNVPSAPFEQHDITVTVPLRYHPGTAKRVTTRYFIAESDPPPQTVASGWSVPSDGPPRLSNDAEVILFLHGLGSRAEEGQDLADALHARARQDGKNYTVIAMDLPNQGYAARFNTLEVSPLSEIGHTKDTFVFSPDLNTFGLVPDFDTNGVHHAPLLEFVEDFVVSFVDTLDAQNGGALKGKIRAVVGGSLGGNLSLRLGRRQGIPWLRKVVAWSPGSAWESLGDGADIFKHVAVRTAWENAGGDDSIAPFYTNPPPGLGGLDRDEPPSARWDFFMTEFYRFATHPVPVIPVSQPHLWYRNDWPCFASTVQGDQLAVQETYHPLSRLSHWRLAAEQLVYSHAWDPELGHAPVLDNYVPTLLLTGGADNYPYAQIYDATDSLADQMKDTPGRFVRLGTPGSWSVIAEPSENTGHAINNERPNLLAKLMAKFLHHDYVVNP